MTENKKTNATEQVILSKSFTVTEKTLQDATKKIPKITYFTSDFQRYYNNLKVISPVTARNIKADFVKMTLAYNDKLISEVDKKMIIASTIKDKTVRDNTLKALSNFKTCFGKIVNSLGTKRYNLYSNLDNIS